MHIDIHSHVIPDAVLRLGVGVLRTALLRHDHPRCAGPAVSGRARRPGQRGARGTDLPFDMALDLPLAALADALTEAEIRAVAVANPRRLFGLGWFRAGQDRRERCV